MLDWEGLRRAEFGEVTRRWAFLDHAAVSPLPKRAADGVREYADRQQMNGVLEAGEWERTIAAARGSARALIAAEDGEVALTTSTTAGVNIIAEGFPWQAGDVVVTASDEYPANVYPWMNLRDRGVETRVVPSRDGRVAIEDIEAELKRGARLLALSHVEFATGYRNDLDALAALCVEHGAAFFVDAIQGLGALRIDVSKTPIDFLATGGQKWLLSPEGSGFLYIRKSWIERLRAVGVGSRSVTTSFNEPLGEMLLKRDATRCEGGAYATASLIGFARSLLLFQTIGFDVASERILERAESVRMRATSAGWSLYGPKTPVEESGIVVLERAGVEPNNVVARARHSGVIISSRRGRLRVSPHMYTSDDDLDRLASVLRSV